MKFRCERDLLASALAVTGRAAAKAQNASMQSLSGVLFVLEGDKLTLTGSDLEQTIITSIDVNGEGDGRALIPAKFAEDLIKGISEGSVAVEVEDMKASIATKSDTLSINCLNVSDYPVFPEPAGEEATISVDDFMEAIRQVTPAVLDDQARPLLTGVLLSVEGDEGIRMVATDSYRLALRDLPSTMLLIGERGRVVIPAETMRELTKDVGQFEKMTVRMDDQQASFQVGNTRITTRLIPGDYPNYKQLIPADQPFKVTVNRDRLLSAVKLTRAVNKYNPQSNVKIVIDKNAQEIILSATADQGAAVTHIPADASKSIEDTLTIVFAPGYLGDGLEAITGEFVTLSADDPLKPALLRSDDDPLFTYLLMPVRTT